MSVDSSIVCLNWDCGFYKKRRDKRNGLDCIKLGYKSTKGLSVFCNSLGHPAYSERIQSFDRASHLDYVMTKGLYFVIFILRITKQDTDCQNENWTYLLTYNIQLHKMTHFRLRAHLTFIQACVSGLNVSGIHKNTFR